MRLRRDPIRVLPLEMISACFGWLDLNDRIAASHRSWRHTVLSDRSLWTEYSVPEEPYNVHAHAGLRAMLLRSDPAPFRLTCSADLPDALVALLVQHMHRIQALHLSNLRRSIIISLMAQNAPVLESFSYAWSPEANISVTPNDYLRTAKSVKETTVTLAWSDTHAPRLRSVRLGKFLLPGIGVFSVMESFGGTIPNACRLAQPLVSIFPALTEIQLHSMTQTALDPLLPLPPRLSSVTFTSARIEPIDYVAFLKGCAPATISRLVIDSATSTSIAPAVEQFARAADGPWELFLVSDSDMSLHAAPDVSYNVPYHCNEYPVALQPNLTEALHRVSALSISRQQYAELYESTAWDRALPAVARLELTVRIRHGRAPRADMFENPGTPIDAPSLEELSIRIRAKARDAMLVLLFVASFAHSLACPRLAHIALLATHPDCLGDADLSCIADLAPRISDSDIDGEVIRR